MVYKWAEAARSSTPAGSGTGNPLDRIEALLTSTGDPGSSNGFASAPAAFSFKTRSTRRIHIS